ncbi:hypothetical protein TNCV_3672801 [Trichonephila clavipes]|nr:hypothetical protein TNCV_3672801 [Trichonephila clavipes]
MPSLIVPTDNFISRVFIESSALEQVLAIHSDMVAEWTGLVKAKADNSLGSLQVPRYWAHSGQSFPWLSKALGFLEHSSMLVNVCGNNALCSSEGQGDFRLR